MADYGFMGFNPSGWGSFGNYGVAVDPAQFSTLGSDLAGLGNNLVPGSFGLGAQTIRPDLLSLDGFLGVNGQQGWGNIALGALSGLGGAFMGMKQYGLAKDALAQSQSQFNQNYAAQRQNVNTQLEDRQRARVAATAGGAESVESYMERNRIR